MKKRSFLVFLIILTLCFSCLHGCSFRHDPQIDPSETSQKSDEPISHGSDGKYEYDEYEDHIVLTKWLVDAAAVWVPKAIANKPVTGFGTVFAKSFKLKTIHIPGSIQAIDERAFYMCDHLATVDVADGLKSIGKEAFAGCSVLSVAKIPASVTYIADDAFLYCLNLVIFGEEGSAIQEYADRFQSINFRLVDPETSAAQNQEDSQTENKEEPSVTTTEPGTTAKEVTTAPPTEAPTEPPTTEAPPPPPTEPPTTEPETTTIPDDQIEV